MNLLNPDLCLSTPQQVLYTHHSKAGGLPTIVIPAILVASTRQRNASRINLDEVVPLMVCCIRHRSLFFSKDHEMR
jgi:hypothetical protein